jgi:hypothetical protein
MPSRGTKTQALLLAGASLAVLLCDALPLRAKDLQPGQPDGWYVTAQGPYGFTSGGAPGSFYFQSTPGSAFNSSNGTRGFADYSLAHSLSIGPELGIGNVQATFGVRVAEPLIANGFTPALEQRRYLGAGPRVGLQGSNPVKSSWVVEWQVGAAMLYGDRALDVNGGAVTPLVPDYGANTGSVVNVDGLLGLSYWFNTASKLTLGYRADAYLKATPTYNALGSAAQNADRIDHGPMIRFSIQK